MPRYPQRFWLAAILVAWSVDFLFWDKPAGISFLIFIGLALVGAFILARMEDVRPDRWSILLAGLVVVFAAVTLLRAEPFTRLLNGFIAVCATGLLVATFRSGGWARFRTMEFISSGLSLIGAAVGGAGGMRLALTDEKGKPGRTALRNTLPVLRGLLLAVPIVFVLGALLSSADMIFADQTKAFFDLFQLERLPEYIFRMFYILVLMWGFAGLYRYALVGIPWLAQKPKAVAVSGDIETGAEAEPRLSAIPVPGKFLGATEAFIVLGAVNLLFAFFVAIQFRYFFGGEANITAAGYTYSEYARKGFFELVMVAVLSLLLYLGLNSITRRSTPRQTNTFTVLAVLLVGLVLVMLLSAFQRLLLYEDAYGFTSLRTYTHIFIPWLAFLLVATIALQIFRREALFSGLLLFTIAGFTLTFATINVDGLIARLNIERARNGAELDGQYLLSLSDDATPALVKAYQSTGQPEAVHDLVGGVLACKQHFIQTDEPAAWQSYHPGSALARARLLNMDLSAYPVKAGPEHLYVELSSKQTFDCIANRISD